MMVIKISLSKLTKKLKSILVIHPSGLFLTMKPTYKYADSVNSYVRTPWSFSHIATKYTFVLRGLFVAPATCVKTVFLYVCDSKIIAPVVEWISVNMVDPISTKYKVVKPSFVRPDMIFRHMPLMFFNKRYIINVDNGLVDYRVLPIVEKNLRIFIFTNYLISVMNRTLERLTIFFDLLVMSCAKAISSATTTAPVYLTLFHNYSVPQFGKLMMITDYDGRYQFDVIDIIRGIATYNNREYNGNDK